MHFATSVNAKFTNTALRKASSREGVPWAMVTDNVSHFATDRITFKYRGVGCRRLPIASGYPQSSGLDEKSIRTLKYCQVIHLIKNA